MPQFFLAYHGGTMPETPDAQAALMGRWGAWMAACGDALADGGAPVGGTRTVTADGVSEGGDNPLTGYNIVTADTVDDALALLDGHPHLDDGTIEVARIMPM